MVWLNNSHDSTDTRAVPVRASYEPRMGIFNVFRILRDSYGPVRDPQGCRTAPLSIRTRKGIDTTRIGKNPARASSFAVRGPYGLFTDCLKSLNPYRARKLIMHALKFYGPHTGRQYSYGAARGPCGRTIFFSKQHVNSPGTARTGPGSVMWLMPQSYHTPGPRTDCSRTVPGLFWTKNVRPLTGPAGAPCDAVRILPPRTGPAEF